MKNVYLGEETLTEDLIFIEFQVDHIFFTFQLEKQDNGIWHMRNIYHDLLKMKSLGIKSYKETCPCCLDRITGYQCGKISVDNVEMIKKQRRALISHPNVRLKLLAKGIILEQIVDEYENILREIEKSD